MNNAKSLFLSLVVIFISTVTWAEISKFNSKALEQASLHIEVHNFKEALLILRSVDSSDFEVMAELSFLTAQIYLKKGEPGKATEFFVDASMMDPANGKYYSGTAESYYALGKIKEATFQANLSLDYDPDNLTAKIVLAKIDDRLGKGDVALSRFEDLLKLQPSSERALVAFSHFLEHQNKIQLAIDRLEGFLIKYPKSPHVFDRLGFLYWINNDPNLAIERRTKAEELYREIHNYVFADHIKQWLEEIKSITVKRYDSKPNLDIKIPDEDVDEDKGNLQSEDAEINEPRRVLIQPGSPEPFPISGKDLVITGSGFIINDGKEIVTNRHVVEDAKKIYVRNGLGELKIARIKKLSDLDDLALLSINNEYDENFAISLSNYNALKVGKEAYIMGYPMASLIGDSSPSLTQGIVSKITGLRDDKGTFLLTSKLNKGNSGGPIFSRSGELLGVAVAKLDKAYVLEETGFLPEDVNIGIKPERIKRFIGVSGFTNTFKHKIDSAEELYESMLPSIVMIVSVYPEKNKQRKNNEEYSINDAVSDCKKEYENVENNELSQNQYFNFCECYIYGVDEIYDEKEDSYQKKFDKPSEEFLNKVDQIGNSCFEKARSN